MIEKEQSRTGLSTEESGAKVEIRNVDAFAFILALAIAQEEKVVKPQGEIN